MEPMDLISLLHCTSNFRHSTVLARATQLHIMQNFLWVMWFKMSSVRKVVALQCRNTLHVTSGNHYAV